MVERSPIRERLGFRDGGQGVHQHRVVLAINQRRGDRIPAQRFAEWPHPLTDDGLARSGKDVDAEPLRRRLRACGRVRHHDAPVWRSSAGRSPPMVMINRANR
jgi:hypothetical protein